MCYRLQPMSDSTEQIQDGLSETVSCHVRFPRDLYKWLGRDVPSRYRSVQERVIEIARQAQDAESTQEQAA
jgi:hypothetical protein